MNWVDLIDFETSFLERCWLSAGGSLTRRLRVLGEYSLSVISERRGSAHFDEIAGFGVVEPSDFWVREVVMSLNGVHCVCARSLIPASQAGSLWGDVLELGNRPLGEILYGGCRR